MVRWEPGARERLQAAALELYLSRGFEQTTVAEIARSVGLTERTFFRHFADKREVLFDGQDRLEHSLLDGVAAAPPNATPLQVVGSALLASADFFPDERRIWSIRRQAVIAANPVLQERELLKLAALAAAIAGALRGRGVSEPAATLAAQSSVTVFAVAFGLWIADGEQRSLAEVEHDVLGELAAMSTEAATAASAQSS